MTQALWFDDLQVGMAFRTPGATLTEEAIIRFSLEWDYQTFHADAQAAKRDLQALAKRERRKKGPLRVRSGDDSVNGLQILDTSGHGSGHPHRTETARPARQFGNVTDPGDAVVGRHEGANPTKMRRDTQRAAQIAPEVKGRHPRRYRAGPAPGGPSGCKGGVPRVQGPAKEGVFRLEAAASRWKIRLPQNDCPRRLQPRDDRGIGFRDMISQRGQATGCPQARGLE